MYVPARGVRWGPVGGAASASWGARCTGAGMGIGQGCGGHMVHVCNYMEQLRRLGVDRGVRVKPVPKEGWTELALDMVGRLSFALHVLFER